MNSKSGFTLIEVLIALAVIGIAFAAMAMMQITNLRASSDARLTTEVKAAANQELEAVMAQVLTVTGSPGSYQYAFNDYYWSCPTAVTPSAGALPVNTAPACSGTSKIGDVDVTHNIRGESGVIGEGIVTVTVTAANPHGGRTLTIGNRVTCYDVYPSPSSTAPEPCPVPTSAGGGRP